MNGLFRISSDTCGGYYTRRTIMGVKLVHIIRRSPRPTYTRAIIVSVHVVSHARCTLIGHVSSDVCSEDCFLHDVLHYVMIRYVAVSHVYVNHRLPHHFVFSSMYYCMFYDGPSPTPGHGWRSGQDRISWNEGTRGKRCKLTTRSERG